jgi:hypothetical protein
MRAPVLYCRATGNHSVNHKPQQCRVELRGPDSEWMDDAGYRTRTTWHKRSHQFPSKIRLTHRSFYFMQNLIFHQRTCKKNVFMIIKAKLKYFPRVHPVIGQMPLQQNRRNKLCRKIVSWCVGKALDMIIQPWNQLSCKATLTLHLLSCLPY